MPTIFDTLNRGELKWWASLMLFCIIATAATVAWAVQIESSVDRATNTLERIAEEMERRPTAAEINLQWRTLGRLNPDLKLPPELISN